MPGHNNTSESSSQSKRRRPAGLVIRTHDDSDDVQEKEPHNLVGRLWEVVNFFNQFDSITFKQYHLSNGPGMILNNEGRSFVVVTFKNRTVIRDEHVCTGF